MQLILTGNPTQTRTVDGQQGLQQRKHVEIARAHDVGRVTGRYLMHPRAHVRQRY